MLYGKFMKRFVQNSRKRFLSFPLCRSFSRRRKASVPLCFRFFVSLCLLFFMPLCLPASSWAQQASVDTTQTTLDSPIQLSVTMSAGSGTVDTSGITDFKILSQSSSSSVQIINGRVNSEHTKTYSLLPLREGRLTIPSLPVTVDGKTRYTTPITIDVTKSAATSASSENVRVTASVSDEKPYLGQQFVYTFRLLYGVQITNTSYDAPSFDGFSATQIGDQQTAQRIIGGKRYQEVTISYLLMPLKTGPLTISPAQLKCDVVTSSRSSRSPFDSFFNDPFFGGSQLETRVFRTEPVTIKVQPLPPWTGSEPFSGLVGEFEMKSELASHKANLGESVTLSVTLQGNGNLQDADRPKIQVPDAFKQYADQPESDVKLGADGYSGSRIFRTALVAVKSGSYTITTAPVVYFDPAKKAYRRLAPPPLSIEVTASGAPIETPKVFSPLQAGGSASELQKNKVDFTGRDILSIKTGLDALSSQEPMPTGWFIGFLLAPGVLFLAIFCLFRALKKDERPAAEMARKSRIALKDAAQATGNETDLLSSLYRSLLYAVYARAGSLGESLTSGEAETLLKQNDVDSETATAVSELLGRLESARFGKGTLSMEQQKALVSETRKLVKGLIP